MTTPASTDRLLTPLRPAWLWAPVLTAAFALAALGAAWVAAQQQAPPLVWAAGLLALCALLCGWCSAVLWRWWRQVRDARVYCVGGVPALGQPAHFRVELGDEAPEGKLQAQLAYLALDVRAASHTVRRIPCTLDAWRTQLPWSTPHGDTAEAVARLGFELPVAEPALSDTQRRLGFYLTLRWAGAALELEVPIQDAATDDGVTAPSAAPTESQPWGAHEDPTSGIQLSESGGELHVQLPPRRDAVHMGMSLLLLTGWLALCANWFEGYASWWQLPQALVALALLRVVGDAWWVRRELRVSATTLVALEHGLTTSRSPLAASEIASLAARCRRRRRFLTQRLPEEIYQVFCFDAAGRPHELVEEVPGRASAEQLLQRIANMLAKPLPVTLYGEFDALPKAPGGARRRE